MGILPILAFLSTSFWLPFGVYKYFEITIVEMLKPFAMKWIILWSNFHHEKKRKIKRKWDTCVNKLQLIKSVEKFFFSSPPPSTITHTHTHTHTLTISPATMHRPPPLWCVRISSVIVKKNLGNLNNLLFNHR